MLPIEKVYALVTIVSRKDVESMRPAQRQRLAQALRRVADLADPPQAEAPKSGVLADLGRGDRGH